MNRIAKKRGDYLTTRTRHRKLPDRIMTGSRQREDEAA